MLAIKAALILAVSYALAQPSIDLRGIRNSASLAPPVLPGAGIAPGSIFVVSGENIGPTRPVNATLPLKTVLAGSSLNVTVGGIAVSPFIISSSSDEITALLPSQTPVGQGTITTVYNHQTSPPQPITVVPTAIGVYTTDGTGMGPALATDLNYRPIGSLTSARPGQEIVLWSTGAGSAPFDEDVQAPAEPLNLQTNINAQIYVGGKTVSPSFVGRASCCSGLDQINFQLPQEVATGCDVPIAVQTGNVVSNFVTISIAPNGGACSDSGERLGEDFARLHAQRVSNLGFLEISSITSGPGGTGLAPTVITNNAEARFVRYDQPTSIMTRRLFPAPSAGSCTVLSSTLPDRLFGGTPLDAGSVINLTGPKSFSALLTKNGAGTYGANIPVDPFSSGGAYIFTGMGGADVGPFSAALPTGPALAWTNANQIVTVHESAGQLITWTGGDPNGTVLIAGSSGTGSQTPLASAAFICTAQPGVTSFVIPSAVLLALPPSAGGPGTLTVGSHGPLQRLSAPGLDLVVGMTIDEISQKVIYRTQ